MINICKKCNNVQRGCVVSAGGGSALRRTACPVRLGHVVQLRRSAWRKSESRPERRLGRTMIGFLYILRDVVTNRLYVGSTNDLERRIRQHQSGTTPTTKRMTKIMMVFSQGFSTLEEARRAERKLKRMKRKDYLEKIIQDGTMREVP